MEKVKVNKNDLIKILLKNAKKHVAVAEQAMKKYRAAVIKQLEMSLKLARQGKAIRTFINLHQPMNQIDDYTKAIGMLNMSVEDTVELSEVDYGRYVLDKWSWSDQFVATNSHYVDMKS